MDSLKPCPFCHSKNISIWHTHGTLKYHCECDECHWCGKTKVFKIRAVKSWNRRAGEE